MRRAFFNYMPDKSTSGVFDHLDELRKRLVVCAIALAVCFAVCFTYSEYLLTILKIPLDYNLEILTRSPFLCLVESASKVDLHIIAPAEAFWGHIKISLVFAIFLAFPVLLTQLWLFVKPALFPYEKKFAGSFIVASTLLFFFGLTFCAFIVLPFALNFLLTYKTEQLVPMLTFGSYIDFTLKFLLSFGLIFQTPALIVFLVKFNILTPQMLKENRKYAILIIFIVSAVLTPTPDVFNQCVMAVPLMLLYEISLLVSGVIYKKSTE